MAVLRITEQALSELRKLVAAAEAKRPVVCVSWQPRQADNKRGRNGETVWTWLSEGQWFVGVLDYADPEIHEIVKDSPTQSVHGMEFTSPILGAEGREVQKPELDYRGTAFVVRESAI
jgi:hypothetical protein